MTHRPYPSIDRARHQIERHDAETPPYRKPRPLTPFQEQLARNAQRALRAAEPTLALAAARLSVAFRPRLVGSEEKTP